MKTFKQWRYKIAFKKAQKEVAFIESQLDALKVHYDTMGEILKRAGRL